jgi:hypothetical protein
MAGFSLNNTFLLLLGVGALWFFARFILGPRRGAPGLKAMFSREKVVPRQGIGKDAIRTLLEETRAFVVRSVDLRGLILAGPFAVEAATPASRVTLVILCRNIAAYTDKEWMPRWTYPARGHPISAHAIKAGVREALHEITLRGSPPLALHFVQVDVSQAEIGQAEKGEIPPSLRAALGIGASVIEDSSGLAEKLRLSWLDEIRKASSAES